MDEVNYGNKDERKDKNREDALLLVDLTQNTKNMHASVFDNMFIAIIFPFVTNAHQITKHVLFYIFRIPKQNIYCRCFFYWN